MPVEEPITAQNTAHAKVEDVRCDCGLLWSLAHQFAYLRLSDKVGENEYKLVDLYAARARRIAATYARFYLEFEKGGDTSKRGRYYWMALGAFASKTVSCLLDSWQLQASYAVFIKAIANGLAKGNLWLFCDIAPSHWLYNNYRNHFHEGLQCGCERDFEKLEAGVRSVLLELPWAQESIPTIKNFRPSEYIKQGFELVKRIESTQDDRKASDLRMKQLLAVANHEQLEVLQPLIYEDPLFAKWTWRQREWWTLRKISPEFQLSFSYTCEAEEDSLRSDAPDTMVVEDFASRMDWILTAANKFHTLMLEHELYMLGQLNMIATWVKSPDATLVY